MLVKLAQLAKLGLIAVLAKPNNNTPDSGNLGVPGE